MEFLHNSLESGDDDADIPYDSGPEEKCDEVNLFESDEEIAEEVDSVIQHVHTLRAAEPALDGILPSSNLRQADCLDSDSGTEPDNRSTSPVQIQRDRSTQTNQNTRRNERLPRARRSARETSRPCAAPPLEETQFCTCSKTRHLGIPICTCAANACPPNSFKIIDTVCNVINSDTLIVTTTTTITTVIKQEAVVGKRVTGSPRIFSILPPNSIVDTSLFARIPSELMRHIMSFLRGSTLATCAMVCRRWYGFVNDPSLWEACVHREFQAVHYTGYTEAWKSLYIMQYRKASIPLRKLQRESASLTLQAQNPPVKVSEACASLVEYATKTFDPLLADDCKNPWKDSKSKMKRSSIRAPSVILPAMRCFR